MSKWNPQVQRLRIPHSHIRLQKMSISLTKDLCGQYTLGRRIVQSRHLNWIGKRFQLIPRKLQFTCFQLLNFKSPTASNNDGFAFVCSHLRMFVRKLAIRYRYLIKTHYAIKSKVPVRWSDSDLGTTQTTM